MTFISYAQNFEDVMLWRALKHVQAGFYIDVGAGHPDDYSVTRAFYDRGWRGINIEPTSRITRLAGARPLDLNLHAAAVGQATDKLILFVVEDNKDNFYSRSRISTDPSRDWVHYQRINCFGGYAS
jgi:methyltransferase FkbM-like protein